MIRFTLRWDGKFAGGAYRVSLPMLLPNDGDSMECVRAEDYDELLRALEQVAGHFIPGQRNTYAPAAKTLDLIRDEVESALVRHRSQRAA